MGLGRSACPRPRRGRDSPARHVLSSVARVSMFLSLVRTNAGPLPGFTWLGSGFGVGVGFGLGLARASPGATVCCTHGTPEAGARAHHGTLSGQAALCPRYLGHAWGRHAYPVRRAQLRHSTATCQHRAVTCRNSTIFQGWPSNSMVSPFLKSAVVPMLTPAAACARAGRTPGEQTNESELTPRASMARSWRSLRRNLGPAGR